MAGLPNVRWQSVAFHVPELEAVRAHHMFDPSPVRFFNLLQLRDRSMRNFRSLVNAFLAVLVVALVGCASTRTQEGTGEYIDDTIITTRVKAAIFNDPNLKSAEINVETFKGAVQLSGFVSSAEDIRKAVELARETKGVTSVKNDMRVKGR